jgi:hypothetical protein
MCCVYLPRIVLNLEMQLAGARCISRHHGISHAGFPLPLFSRLGVELKSLQRGWRADCSTSQILRNMNQSVHLFFKSNLYSAYLHLFVSIIPNFNIIMKYVNMALIWPLTLYHTYMHSQPSLGFPSKLYIHTKSDDILDQNSNREPIQGNKYIWSSADQVVTFIIN